MSQCVDCSTSMCKFTLLFDSPFLCHMSTGILQNARTYEILDDYNHYISYIHDICKDCNHPTLYLTNCTPSSPPHCITTPQAKYLVIHTSQENLSRELSKGQMVRGWHCVHTCIWLARRLFCLKALSRALHVSEHLSAFCCTRSSVKVKLICYYTLFYVGFA